MEVSDSAGVRLVLNPLPHPDAGPHWRVGPEPTVAIGASEGAAEYELFHVSGAVVLSDGELVIANQGTNELRFYDDRGRYLRSAGGEGDGPGEFRALELVDRFAGDSLLTFDRRSLRASIFDHGGRFARSFSVGTPTNAARPAIAGVLSSGRVVIRENQSYVAGIAQTGLDRSPARLLLEESDGTHGDTLGSFPGAEIFVMALPSEMWMSARPVTFGRRLVTAVAGDRIAVAETDTFEVRLYGPDGALREIIRQRRVPVEIRTADVTRFDDSVLSTVEDERSRQHYREMFDLMPKHDVFPALASIRLDRVGSLWVEEYEPPGHAGSTWQVFDERGTFAARVRLPKGLEVLDIGTDYVVGVVQDDLGVEQVRWYSMERASSRRDSVQGG